LVIILTCHGKKQEKGPSSVVVKDN
jgi:hypothetical protein